MTRRRLLQLSSAGFLARPALRASEPRNLSYPLRAIQGNVTAPNLFFIRDHFDEPEVPLESWRLRIEGCVARPYELSFSDLLESPTKKLEAVLECAGNTAGGSAASNGVWEGVSMAALIQSAGVTPEGRFVVFEGADTGKLRDGAAALPYSQRVPIQRCMDGASLVAFKVNDVFLPKGNGFPARALFPGCYAMDSVKWLRRILVVSDEDRQSSFYQSGMNRLYNRVMSADGGFRMTRLSSILVKSAIAWPNDQIKLPAGRHEIRGFAWTGAGAIHAVAVSTDDAKSWNRAVLDFRPAQFGWIRWTYSWNAAPGDFTLMSRASDAEGNQQPLHRDPTRKDSYELNWCLPVHCAVR